MNRPGLVFLKKYLMKAELVAVTAAKWGLKGIGYVCIATGLAGTVYGFGSLAFSKDPPQIGLGQAALEICVTGAGVGVLRGAKRLNHWLNRRRETYRQAYPV